jgi:hypothetical protein
LEGVEDFMAAVEAFMGVAAILVAVAMDGAAAAMGGVVVVTGAAGTVEDMGVVGTGAVGMAVVRIGGGVTHTRMDTALMVGKSDKQKKLNRGWTRIGKDRPDSGARIWARGTNEPDPETYDGTLEST